MTGGWSSGSELKYTKTSSILSGTYKLALSWVPNCFLTLIVLLEQPFQGPLRTVFNLDTQGMVGCCFCFVVQSVLYINSHMLYILNSPVLFRTVNITSSK